MSNSLDLGMPYSPTSPPLPLPTMNMEYNDLPMPFTDSDDEALLDTIMDQPPPEVFPEPGADQGLQEMLAHFESSWRKIPLDLPLALEHRCIVCREVKPSLIAR